MDRERFDAMVRLLATAGSRRAALGALVGAGLAGTNLDVTARKGNSQGKNRGGNGNRNDRDKSKRKRKGRERTNVRGEARAGRCCSTGNCTPGKGKNLAKCCYQNQNLANKNFSGANLGSANFSDAILTGANFSGANLGKACFVDANITGAIINGSTNLGGAIFCRTQTDTEIDNSGCDRGTACCPTCDDEHPCGDGEVCCNGRCLAGNCCDNGAPSACGSGEICCDNTCVAGDCCTNAQCENPTPVCNESNLCVPCTDDEECGQNGVCTCGGNVEAGQCQGDFFQGFEQNTAGWSSDILRVSSGTSGIPARTGGFYAKAFQGPSDGTKRFTRWGGYSNEFPSGGYTTELAVYLDPPNGPADTQFDYSSAINQPNCQHRRDFIFSVGKRSTNPNYCVSASNNSPGDPCNPGRNAVVLTKTGWYVFRHVFKDVGGILAVDCIVEDPDGIQVYSLTLSDPSDVIGSTVGGNRYGWIVINDFTFVAIDDSARES